MEVFDYVKSWWSYGAVGAFAVIVIFWIVQQVFTGALNKVGEHIFGEVAKGKGILSRRSLLRYRDALLTKDLHRGKNLAIDKIYVPTQFEVDGLRYDLYSRVRDEHRVVVLGSAGAGKSMFLRYWQIRWAKAPRNFRRVPILVDLHLYDGNPGGLRKLILGRLAERGIKCDDAKLENALQTKRLSLLLDGLDEVVVEHRNILLSEIRTLASTHDQVQVVVTCRDAVYEKQLKDVFGEDWHISGFDDAGIRRYLRLWFDHRSQVDGHSQQASHLWHERARESVEQVMADLRANPAMLRLARSPLLLSMMAELQASDPGLGSLLTHSRAEFYEKAIDHMLKREIIEGRFSRIAEFRAAHKLIALRRIAFVAQSSETGAGARNAVTESDALHEVTQVLQRYQIESTRAPKMLEEIVLRSELLLKIDDRSLLYGFPHLTMQEYLAALELSDDPDRMLEFYRGNRSRWRETVKLWCGAVQRDSSRVLTQLFAGDVADKLLALECLAETRQVNEDTASAIIDHFKHWGADEEPMRDLIVMALGAVASSSSSWGRDALEYLSAQAQTPGMTGALATRALAATRLPAAIEILVRLSTDGGVNEARSAVRLMGEQAIVALARRVSANSAGSAEAVDDLAAIGTPSAAVALAEILAEMSVMDTPAEVERRVAWQIAGLLLSPEVEEELRRSAPALGRHNSAHDWFWQPFAEPDGMLFGRLMSYVAYLLAESSSFDIPGDLRAADPRLILPAALVGRHTIAINDSACEVLVDVAKQMALTSTVSVNSSQSDRKLEAQQLLNFLVDRDDARAELVCDAVLAGAEQAKFQRAVRLLPWRIRCVVLTRLLGFPVSRGATKDEWVAARDAATEPRLLGRVYVSLTTLLTVGLLLLGLTRLGISVFGGWRWGPAWQVWLGLALAVVGVVAFGWGLTLESDGVFFLGFFTVVLFLSGITVLALYTFVQWLGWSASGAGLAGILCLVVILGYSLRRRRRRYTNPFRGLLDMESAIPQMRAIRH